MKQENCLWGCHRIADELKKIGIDFMTIDTLFGKRFYLLIILELKTRRIVQWNLTENPCREFVKQRIELFTEDFPDKKTLIYDNALQFISIDYSWYGIQGVNISPAAPKAGRKQAFCSPMHPGMNAYTERVVGTIRREVLNYFLLFTEKQVRNIIKQYVEYYNFVVLVRLFYGIDQNNHQRPHQGINKIPVVKHVPGSGNIQKDQILGGLHHNYYRSSA